MDWKNNKDTIISNVVQQVCSIVIFLTIPNILHIDGYAKVVFVSTLLSFSMNSPRPRLAMSSFGCGCQHLVLVEGPSGWFIKKQSHMRQLCTNVTAVAWFCYGDNRTPTAAVRSMPASAATTNAT